MNWNTIINKEKTKDYFLVLEEKLDVEYENYTVYPKKEDIFRAFDLCSYEDTKLVIIGQDPYHGPRQANGLSFSVYAEEKLPPSLRNIYKELEDDLSIIKKSGELEGWAKQGVLMLNKIMTVREKTPASHANLGWDTFTDEIILSLNDHPQTIIFLLWGNYAKKVKPLIAEKHIILEGVHPSPLSAYRGFFGSKPFSLINDKLTEINREPIDWSK